MLLPSELFERLHHERKECEHRTKGVWHATTRIVVAPSSLSCPCAQAFMAQAISLQDACGSNREEIKKAFGISDDALEEIERRYEGWDGYHPHTFGELAVWLRSIGH